MKGTVMKKVTGAAYLAAVGVALSGCSTSEASGSAAAPQERVIEYVSPKEEALQALEYQGIVAILRDADGFYGSWSEDDIRDAIDLTCDGFASSEGAGDIRDEIAAEFGEPSNREAFEVQQVMSASVGIRCEEYKGQQGTIESWDVLPKSS